MVDYEQAQAFGGVVDVLEAIGATYAIWVGMAVIAYGEPRFTQDVDILLSPAGFPVALFVRRLCELGYHVDEGAVHSALSSGELAGGFFNAIHLHYQVKVDFYVPREPVLQALIAERVSLPFDEARRAACVTMEGLSLAKLRPHQESGSTRHLEDVASVICIQRNDLVSRIRPGSPATARFRCRRG